MIRKRYHNLKSLKKILISKKAKKILVICGKASFHNLFLKNEFLEILNGYEVKFHNDFEVNPKFDDIKRGTKIAFDFLPDIIIGIGGGSVMDTSKLINCLSHENNEEDITNFNPILSKISDCLILIPTTAGSGSEETHFSVLYVENKKYSISDNRLYASYVILDEKLTFSLPKNITLSSGLDCLCQAIEGFWSIKSNKLSKSYSKKSLSLFFDNFEKILKNLDPNLRKPILIASNFSGRSINIAKTTAPHALSYSISIKYNIPHGHAVALTLPAFFEYNLDENSNLTSELLQILKVNSIKQGKLKIEELINKTGLETKLSKIGATNKIEILDIVKEVNLERLNNNPKKVSKKKLIEIIESIW